MKTAKPGISTYLQNLDFPARKLFGIDRIETELADIISGSHGVIREMSQYIFTAGGKRIRPLIALYSGLIFSDLTLELIRVAAAVELIHMASLVHDDIIDEADCRRSRPSINKIWGPKYAVLCGDYLFTKAFEILAENPHAGRILKLMANTVQCMSDGELRQAEDRYSSCIGIERYYERISLKTAVFSQNTCRTGAIIGGAETKYISFLGGFGLHFGLAFQICDDILDFSGDSTMMGKPKFEDLRNGNITLPVILLLEHHENGAWLKDLIMRRELNDSILTKIENLLKETGILNKTYNVALFHLNKAKNYLLQLPWTSYTQFLEDLANKLMVRSF